MINWKVRFRNKFFLMAIVSLIVKLLNELGLNIVPDNWEAILNLVLGILTMLGVVIDPTTKGTKDSNRALGYDYPQ